MRNASDVCCNAELNKLIRGARLRAISEDVDGTEDVDGDKGERSVEF